MYGIPQKSLDQLKNKKVIGIVSKFDIIKKIKREYDLLLTYITAEPEIVRQRLLARGDQKNEMEKSIRLIGSYLEEYIKNRDLIDFEINNNGILEDAKKQLIEIINLD